MTTQISRQKQAKKAPTCSSWYFLHGVAEGIDNTDKSSILLIERHSFEVLRTVRLDTKKFELWKIERETKIFLFLDLEIEYKLKIILILCFNGSNNCASFTLFPY